MCTNVSTMALILLLASPSSLSATLTHTTTSLSSSLNPSIYGESVTFTAVVTSSLGAPPNGETVTFKQGATTLGTGSLKNGTAIYTISTLTTGGTDNIKATYAGDSKFSASTSSVVAQVVNEASSTTTLSSSQNPSNNTASVTLTAKVAPQFSGIVTGTASFYNGSKKLGTSTLVGGAAVYTTTTLPVGSDPLTAVYNGGKSFTTSTSAILNQNVEEGTFLPGTMTWDGITRYYQVYVPAVLPANPSLLLMLHGTRYDVPPNNPTTLDWGWQGVADEYGFIEVQPASTYDTSTGQWNWNSYFMDPAFQGPPPDDSGFLRQLIVNLTTQYRVNPKSVFVTGMSSGAQMSERVGVDISDLVAAIAPTSGQLVGQQVPPPGLPGNALAPVAVQEWHGTTDTELPPCNYGTTVYSGVTFTLDTVDDTFNYWVKQNSCTSLQTSQTLCLSGSANPNVTGNIATSCSASNVEVQFIWEEGVGHAWQAKNNVARWLFLSAHSKP